MPETRLGAARWAAIAALAAATLGLGLGRAGRLTYHEAIVAQAAREMVASGDGLVPTIGGRPWLEKPPLAVWLVALISRAAGGVGEASARLPSALAGVAVAGAVAALAARRFGPTVGLLAGLVQATTAWTIVRGRLAEADILLAALVAATVLAFDRMRDEPDGRRPWRWAFFAALGMTALAKGIGFGAVLVASVVVLALVWDRDRPALRRLAFPAGWTLAGALALAWPALVLARHPEASRLWTLHVADRLAARPEHFASGPWWQYGPALLGQVLPWTPLALIGAARSLRRAVAGRSAGDRLLWAWAVGPVALLSLATVKNAHYVIYALSPWSVWTALTLDRLGGRLRRLGWSPGRVRRAAWVLFGGLGLACGVGFAWLGPRLDRRGVEWAFYEAAGRALGEGEPLVLLYDDWDRAPYPTPFGPVPHDLAVRLFYVGRPASWRQGADALAADPPAPAFAVLGRDRDVPALRRLGRVETVLRGPTLRARASKVDDRTFALYRVMPEGLASSRPYLYGSDMKAAPGGRGCATNPGVRPDRERRFQFWSVLDALMPLDQFIRRIASALRALRGKPAMTGTPPSARPPIPSDPAEHAVDFSTRYAIEMDYLVSQRMLDLGIPTEQSGARDLTFGHSAFKPHETTGGGNAPGGGLTVDSGVFNLDLFSDLGPEVCSGWAKSRLRDRLDAVITHEHAEARCGSHEDAVRLAIETELPIREGLGNCSV